MESQFINNNEIKINEEVVIFIPTYGNEHLLFECVRSCISQTYKNIKIFIIDNGNNDPLISVREKLLEFKDSRVNYYGNTTDMGSQNSIHLILSLAETTRRFMIIPADLMLVRHCIETLIDAAKKNPNVSMIYPRQIVRDIKKNNLNNIIENSEKPVYWPHNGTMVLNPKILIQYYFNLHNLHSEWSHFTYLGALLDGGFVRSVGINRNPTYDHGLEELISLTLLSYSEKVMVINEALVILYTNNTRLGSASRPTNNYTRYEPIFTEYEYLEKFESLLIRRNIVLSKLYSFLLIKTLYTIFRYPGPIFFIIPKAIKSLIKLIFIIIPTEIIMYLQKRI